MQAARASVRSSPRAGNRERGSTSPTCSTTPKHVADLLDDADALADWHRNLERLRRGEHG